MITLAIRSLVATVAAAAVLIGTWLWNPAAPEAAPALGRVLKNTLAADTLQLQITRDGKSASIWVRRSGQLRWNEPDGTYRIARDGRLWTIDEKANRASSQPAAWFRPGQAGLDLLALLDLSLGKDRDSLLEAKPAERVQRDGLECDLYRWEVAQQDRRLQVEALVDAGSEFLHSLEVKTQRDGRPEPLRKLTVVALNQPVDEGLFVVGDTLTEDGRIGKITDVQGIASIRPVMAQRWTPLADRMLLRPGDWLQTDLRGANAAALRLVPQTGLTLGPGALVELLRPNQVRLAEGDLKVVAAPKSPIELLGPGQQKVAIEGTQVYRVQNEKLVRLEKDPLWLRGFEGRTNNESIGSLVAKIDGRNVPLTVGYHKVKVDIRDQIARTVIEESFVNHTPTILEGVFYFPLPQDASIAGFGMWIGDALVEADVVEKQRAREIYETILRERRDPGLLEWTGGNLFKARVFPIPGHSEKRITITYTQVLPLRGNRYRYQYALQSEMLKQHPLRELAIDLNLNSAMPLKSVASPTHTTRIETTAHAAHVEFAAQEYTPSRDFEVAVEVDGRQAEVVMIPHRRGDDGYFLVQLTPPAAGDAPERDVLPDGEPVELLILADTSASIDAAARKVQADLVAGLAASLTTRDALNLATCDVDCRWVFDKPRPAEAKNLAAARQFLASRVSLGWTDLDKAFASALRQCGPKTHVIYLGDGIVTTGDGDPVALVKRLRRLAEGKPGTFHAVALGSSFEPGVLKAIAALGDGSFRQVGGERGPRAVALELLGEITRPTIRGLKVEFHGLRAARVYPEELPNLAAGCQQILLGRYLPEGRDQAGEVLVTGTQGGKPVRFASRVSLKDAEQGNSFIPRLWARMHLDALLQQGSSQAVQDEIIALSEEYHIMTPYTSFLVLESDADRERFKVKRRFLMRDGEKFFAQGRDNAHWGLVQKQMKRAGNWRVGLRRSVLQQLSGSGRQQALVSVQRFVAMSHLFVGSPNAWDENGDFSGAGAVGVMGGFFEPMGGPMGGGMGGGEFQPNYDYDVIRGLGMAGDAPSPSQPFPAEDSFFAETKPAASSAAPGDERANRAELGLDASQSQSHAEEEYTPDNAEGKKQDLKRLSEMDDEGSDKAWKREISNESEDLSSLEDRRSGRASASLVDGWSLGVEMAAKPASGYADFGVSAGAWGWRHRGSMGPPAWLGTLFASPPAAPVEAKSPKTVWPAPARALAQSLLRTDAMVSVKDGLRFERLTETFDAPRAALSSRAQTLALVTPAAWLMRSASDGGQTTVTWCDRSECGSFSKVFQLGRLRASTPLDLRRPPIELGANTATSLDRSHAGWPVEVKPQGEQRTLLTMTSPGNDAYEIRVLIDTSRHVILRIDNVSKGKLVSTMAFAEFFQTAGAWWPGRIENQDEKGRRTSLVTQKLVPLAVGQFDRLWKEELAGRGQVQLVRDPLPRLVDAKRAIAVGKPAFEDHLVLLLYFQGSQQWQRVLEQLDKAERLAAGKPGLRWVRSAILSLSRHREEVKQRYLEEAARLAKAVALLQDNLPSPPAPLPQAGEGRVGDEESYLAGYLVDQAAGVCEGNEMLGLLEVLRPLHARQPAYREAMKRWNQRRADYLEQTGQRQDALQLRKQLAEQYAHDYALHQHYVQALVREGEYEAAYAWLKQALAKNAAWNPSELDSLHNTCAESMRSQGRYPELVDYLAAWLKQNPQSFWANQQYLSALVWANRADEANALIARWLKEGQRKEPWSPELSARFQAALSQALGQGYNLYTDRLDERWPAPLAETALFLAEHDSQIQYADQIMNHWRFQSTDECRRVRAAAAKMLRSGIDKLSPAQLDRFVNWISSNDPAVEAEAWRQIIAGLRRRWDAAAKAEVKNQLGQTLARALSGHAPPAEWIAFLRLQREQGPQQYHSSYTVSLLDALLTQPWSAAYENEAFTLLEKLNDSENPIQQLAAQVATLHRLTDRMVQARFDARMKAVEHQEKLTRTELRAKKEENLRQARIGFADRLQGEMARRPAGLARWINAERLCLDTRLGRNLDRVEAECWEYLGPEPAKADGAKPAQALDTALRDRLLVTLLNLAARKGAKAAQIERALGYLDRTAKAHPEDIRWKLYQFQLLVALDRPKDLQAKLGEWVRAGDFDNRWRLSLAYLLAEQGQIEQAIQLFEAIEAADELRPTDYRTLADWYMVAGRRELHDRARVMACKTIDEWRLSNWVSQNLRSWQRSDRPLPRELDQEVLVVFRTLFEKSDTPQNHLQQARQFYEATRDFRLLAGLADAVVGHTAGQVYPFLQGMTDVLSEVRDEATADSIVERLAEVRKRARTAIDQRALDLLEAIVERRAAELLNQPGPHVDRAVAALERAWKRQWSPGEPRLVADLLSGLGAISQPKLAHERMRQLESLHRQAARGSLDRLHIAHAVARAYWNYARQEQAIDLLQAALDECQSAAHGTLPVAADGAMDTLIGYLEARTHHARGEKTLQDQLRHPANRQQAYRLTQRLYRLYRSAIAVGGDVSLGKGAELYRAVNRNLQAELDTPDHNHRTALVSLLCAIYRIAHEKNLPGVAEDLKAFAFRRLPEALKRQTTNLESIVGEVANTLHDLASPRDGLAFLVVRIEAEPAWLRYNNQDGWSRHSSTLGRWREEAKDLGESQEPLLRIVLGELRRDLRSGQQRSRMIYHRQHGYFWAAQEKAFAQAAEEVLADRKQSGAAAAHIAEYLYWGLDRRARAIEVLLDAHRREVLDEAGQSKLVRFLHQENRHGESIALLEPLVERRPDNLQYRVWLMHAYFHTKQPQQLLTLLKKSDAYFHQKNNWQEPTIAGLAQACLTTQLYQQSVDYFNEAIPLHQRTQPRRGIGDGTLSSYYGSLAQAYAGLKKTAEAVDAASGAIVSWGNSQRERTQALESLKHVIRQAPNLDAYVAQLDRQNAATGLHNPVVRKAIGQIYLERQDYAKAVRQLDLAVELQPNDAEIHKALVACCDGQHDKEGAVRRVLQWRELARRDIKLCEDLARRFETLEQPEEAERAVTSIVEALPGESESHALLAEIRQRQNRWPEAIVQWEQVARIRVLEPTGLQQLAAAQIHQRQWESAETTLRKLETTAWPPRFGDVPTHARSLRQQLEDGKRRPPESKQ